MPTSLPSRLRTVLKSITREQWIRMYELDEINTDKLMVVLHPESGRPLVDLPTTKNGLQPWVQRISGIGEERASAIAAQVWERVEKDDLDGTPARPTLGE